MPLKLSFLDGVKTFKSDPRIAFIVHGEPQGADTVRHTLEEKLRWNCMVPDHGQS